VVDFFHNLWLDHRLGGDRPELSLPPQVSVLSGGILGLSVGVSQWFILRQWFKLSWWWIIVSTLGWALGLTGFLGESLVGAVVGAVTGFALELLLRNQRETSKITVM